MKQIYQHTQISWVIPCLMGLAALSIIVPVGLMPGIDLMLRLLIIGGNMFIILIIAALFYKGHISMEDEKIVYRFGIGLISKAIPLTEIESCKRAQPSLLAGIGIHRTKNGWLYNVSSGDAVEFKLKSGKSVLFGTDEPARLCAVVRQRLKEIKESGR